MLSNFLDTNYIKAIKKAGKPFAKEIIVAVLLEVVSIGCFSWLILSATNLLTTITGKRLFETQYTVTLALAVVGLGLAFLGKAYVDNHLEQGFGKISRLNETNSTTIGRQNIFHFFYIQIFIPQVAIVFIALIFVVYFSLTSLVLGGILLLSYLILGMAIPIWFYRNSLDSRAKSRRFSRKMDKQYSEFVLGLGEVMQYSSFESARMRLQRLNRGIHNVDNDWVHQKTILYFITECLIWLSAIIITIMAYRLSVNFLAYGLLTYYTLRIVGQCSLITNDWLNSLEIKNSAKKQEKS